MNHLKATRVLARMLQKQKYLTALNFNSKKREHRSDIGLEWVVVNGSKCEACLILTGAGFRRLERVERIQMWDVDKITSVLLL